MISQVVDNIEKAKQNDIIIDIDHGVNLLEAFLVSTKPLLNDFKKLQGKVKNKDVKVQKKRYLAFTKEKLYFKFKTEFADKFYKNNVFDNKNVRDIYIYILGMFTIGNSSMDIDRSKALANSLKELTDIIYSVEKKD